MICKVIEFGLVYNRYWDKAKELGADINNSNPKKYSVDHKWRYGQSIGRNGGTYKILNGVQHNKKYKYTKTFYLIERLSDGRQFVIDKKGVKILEYYLEDKLFEI